MTLDQLVLEARDRYRREYYSWRALESATTGDTSQIEERLRAHDALARAERSLLETCVRKGPEQP